MYAKSWVNATWSGSLPTSVAVGPDGAYYVGELTGAPFATGAARVYRVVRGQDPEVYLEGFTTIIDLAFGPDGSLYVLQHSSAGGPPPPFAAPGSLVRVAPDAAGFLQACHDVLALDPSAQRSAAAAAQARARQHSWENAAATAHQAVEEALRFRPSAPPARESVDANLPSLDVPPKVASMG